MTVQTVQNAGITGTGKDNRQSAAARDTFMEMLNTHLNQASDRKNANAGPGKAASQPGQKSGEPVKKEENTAGKASRDTQDKTGDALKETAGNAEDKPADKVEKPGKEQTEAAAGILMEEQMQQNGWEMILPGEELSGNTGSREEEMSLSGIVQTADAAETYPAGTEQNPAAIINTAAGETQYARGKKTDRQTAGTAEDISVLKDSGLENAAQAGSTGVKAAGNGQEAFGDSASSYGDMLKEQSELLKAMAGIGKEEKDTETSYVLQDKETDTEALQKKVDEKAYLPLDRMIAVRTADRPEITAVPNTQTEAVPVMQQVKTGLEEGMAKGMNHFTIRLKPEGLGEIVVRMVTEGGRISMRIGVSNEDTQRLINSELLQLKEALQPLNAQVQEVYHSGFGGMDFSGYQQDMYRQQHQMTGGILRHFGATAAGEEEDTPEIPVYNRMEGSLYAYI